MPVSAIWVGLLEAVVDSLHRVLEVDLSAGALHEIVSWPPANLHDRDLESFLPQPSVVPRALG